MISKINWSKEEEERLKSLLTENTIADIARILGRSYDSVKNKAASLRRKSSNGEFHKPVIHNLWSKEEEERLKTIIKDSTVSQASDALGRSYDSVMKKLRSLKIKLGHRSGRTPSQSISAVASAEAVSDIVKNFEKKKVANISIKSSGNMSESTAFGICSDWHFEESVEPSTVNGINEYNPQIAEKRAKLFFSKFASFIKMFRNNTKIDNVVLALLGDFISGYIHEELMESNYMSPTQSVMRVRDVIVNGINFLLDDKDIKKITVPCAYGNHGRTTKKPHVSTGYMNNLEWMMYHFIAEHFKDEKRVEFIISNGYSTRLEVYGRRIRFHHGDAIKGGGGIGGITIPIKKKIARWNQEYNADLDVFGHFHQWTVHKDFIVNGSMIGWNAFAEKIGAEFEKPQQGFFLLNKDYGVTFPTGIDLRG